MRGRGSPTTVANRVARLPAATARAGALLLFVLGIASLLFVLGIPSAAAQSFYSEAPDLGRRVAVGELPRIDDRVPRNPLLLSVEEVVGEYGGDWTMAMIGRGDGVLLYRTLGYEHLVRWDPAWRRVIPNIAQAFHASDDARVFTFRLRPGMRWSDGQPFTAEDIRFWFYDILTDDELALPRPEWLPERKGAARLEVDDPYTVRFVFDEPNSLFLASLASASNATSPVMYPRHALMRFHRRYNAAGIDEAVRRAGVADWTQLFVLKARLDAERSDPTGLLRRPASADAGVEMAEPIPTLDAWVVDRLEPGDPPRLIAERNPYYWKIDPAGNQLPYLDRVVFLLTPSQQRFNELLEAGAIVFQARHVASPSGQARIPDLLAKGYRTVRLVPTETNAMPIGLNLTHPDPMLRTLFADRSFRIALSHAIDRKAIIERVFGGEGEPFQVAPRRESRFFTGALALRHLEYDPAAANATLDGLGLSVRDADGVRLMPDGRRLCISILVRLDRSHHRRALEMVAADWRAIGIDARIEVRDRTELTRLQEENRFDATVLFGDGGIDAIQEAYAYIPALRPSVAPLWNRWFVGDRVDGVEPPTTVRDQLALLEKLRRTADPDEQDRLMRAVLEIAADAFYQIGISTQPETKAVARQQFRNIPPAMMQAWAWPTPAPSNPPQYFLAQ